MKKEYAIEGMTCSACAIHVTKSVEKLKGLDHVNVDLMNNSLSVEVVDESLDVDRLISQAVKAAGYKAIVTSKVEGATGGVESTPFEDELQGMKRRLLVSFAATIPLFYIAMGHMFNWPLPKMFLGVENALSFAFTQFLLTLIVVAANKRVFVTGFRTLGKFKPTMDSLIAVGSAAALIYGVFALYQIGFGLGHQDLTLANQYSMDLYFESAGMILTLVLLGKYLEARAKGRTGEAVRKLMDLSPKVATVIRDQAEVVIPVEQLKVGDIVVVRPGQRIPVDGTILSGMSALDESALTGESMPVEKGEGDYLLSASINTSGALTYRADRVGEDTTLAQIISLVQSAGASKAPISQLADRISAVFVPIVMLIALTATVIWLSVGTPFDFALSIGIAVLVISCPCALGLATPAAIMVGTGKGAEYGVLSTSGEALQALSTLDSVVLDKTGTITQGYPVVTDLVPVKGTSEEQLLALAAALEHSSEHPVAKAVLASAEQREIDYPTAESFQALPGFGVQAIVDQKVALIGNGALMREHKIAIEVLSKHEEELSNQGKTLFYVTHGDTLLGLVAVADALKPSSAKAVAQLQALGLEVVMLTGDSERTAQAIARQVGIEHVIAAVLPDGKSAAIASLQAQGKKVAMVGDGINDAPALATADVGIAIGAGSDIAKESADVILMKNDIQDVVTAIRLGRATLRNIKQNLFWAMFYNSLGIPLAAGLFYSQFQWKLNPMFAAAAMSLSSLFVVTNALRLGLFKANGKSHQRRIEMKKSSVTKVLTIEGMTCQHCKMRVEQALNSLRGVEATVDLETKQATVVMKKELNEAKLKESVASAGYEVIAIK